MLPKHRRFYYDYNCSLSFTNEDELAHVKRLKDKLFEELKLEMVKLASDFLCLPSSQNDEVEDLDEWFGERCIRTGRVFDINVYTFSLKDEKEAGMRCPKLGLAVAMYECFQDEQGLWNTDLSKELSFKLILKGI